MRTLVFAAVLAAAAGVQGCASEKSQKASEQASRVALQERRSQELLEIGSVLPKDRSREWAVSWEQSQRGGAALRPASYEHVLGTDRLLQAQQGPLYPELAAPAGDVVSQYMTSGPTGVMTFPAPEGKSSFTPADQDECRAILQGGLEEHGAIVSARRNVDSYLAVKQKLCRGQQRLTYAEWEILVNGTPKDLPVHLQYQGARP